MILIIIKMLGNVMRNNETSENELRSRASSEKLLF